MNGLAIFIIIVIAMYDLWLVGADKPTISQWYHTLFSKRVDITVMIVLAAGVAFLPIFAFLKVALGVVVGHLCWSQRETKASK